MLLGGRVAQLATVLTKSGVYMRTFRLTLTTRTVRAPQEVEVCRASLIEWLVLGAWLGNPEYNL